ncbi:Flp family type IVb pilin, partial [Vibrio pectenicida]
YYCILTGITLVLRPLFKIEENMFNKFLRNCIELKLKLTDDIRGVTAVEYAIIAVVMSGIILLVFQEGTLKGAMNDAMKNITDNISKAKGTS